MLNRWWVKAAAQGALSVLPVAGRLTDRLRDRRGAVLTPDYLMSKWPHVNRHVTAMKRRTGMTPADHLVVELGTGWYPIVPLGMALHGAQVVTIDTARHLDPARIALTMSRLVQMLDAGRISVPDGPRSALLREVVAAGGPGQDSGTALAVLGELGVRPRIADATDLSGVPEVADATLMTSNNTLEHIPPEVIAGIFREFARVASAQARMSHYIDLADHYAAYDPRIGQLHFLTLSQAQWRLANNRLAYQNRLQLPDYLSLLSDTGWQLTRARTVPRDPAELAGLRLRAPFDAMAPEDLLVVKAHLCARRA